MKKEFYLEYLIGIMIMSNILKDLDILIIEMMKNTINYILIH